MQRHSKRNLRSEGIPLALAVSSPQTTIPCHSERVFCALEGLAGSRLLRGGSHPLPVAAPHRHPYFFTAPPPTPRSSTLPLLVLGHATADMTAPYYVRKVD